MLEGTCPNCETKYIGWALSEMRHQTCSKCGSLIKVVGYDKAVMQNSLWSERVVIEKRPTAGEQKKPVSRAFGKGR